MPPMGPIRRSIRMSTFKKMQIPRQIAFSPEQLRIEAKQIEVTLCKIAARRKTLGQ